MLLSLRLKLPGKEGYTGYEVCVLYPIIYDMHLLHFNKFPLHIKCGLVFCIQMIFYWGKVERINSSFLTSAGCA